MMKTTVNVAEFESIIDLNNTRIFLITSNHCRIQFHSKDI